MTTKTGRGFHALFLLPKCPAFFDPCDGKLSFSCRGRVGRVRAGPKDMFDRFPAIWPSLEDPPLTQRPAPNPKTHP